MAETAPTFTPKKDRELTELLDRQDEGTPLSPEEKARAEALVEEAEEATLAALQREPDRQ